jgi:hypothetical protein
MATEKWVSGSGQGLSSWGAAFGTEINGGLVSGNAIQSTIVLDNSSALDIFADFSFLAGGTATTAAPAYLGLYIYPLGQDGSTYGDGRFGSAAAGPPPQCYWAGPNIGFAAAAGTTIAGVWQRVILPPGKCVPVLYNQSGANLYNGANVCKYRTYNRSIA